MGDKALVRIRRFDPTVDREPWYQTYEVPPEGWHGVKVVDTLRYIYENFDAGLSFREPCRQQLCGACMVMVNEKEIMACDTFSEKEMIIEARPKRRVVKDLVTE